MKLWSAPPLLSHRPRPTAARRLQLLRLGETARGGRSRAEIYDLMGVRAVVLPRVDLPQAEAEEAAAQVGRLAGDAERRRTEYHLFLV